jgi:mucosa-associated lymphoid tissue lymphoma translocation protein 1
MNYWEHPKLKAPLVDVYELTNLLRQLNFKVVSLLDLTEYEMCNAVDEFLLLLDKGVYGEIFLIFIFIITILIVQVRLRVENQIKVR